MFSGFGYANKITLIIGMQISVPSFLNDTQGWLTTPSVHNPGGHLRRKPYHSTGIWQLLLGNLEWNDWINGRFMLTN